MAFRHLTRGLQKLAVPGLAVTTDESINRHIIRRVNKGHGRLGPGEQCGDESFVQRVATADAMIPTCPDIAGTTDRERFGGRGLRFRVGCLAGAFDLHHEVDFHRGKGREIQVKAELNESLKFLPKLLVVPSGILRQAVSASRSARISGSLRPETMTAEISS